MGNYLATGPTEGQLAGDSEAVFLTTLDGVGLANGVPHDRAVITGELGDPLLPHVHSYLDSFQNADMAVAFVVESGLDLLEQHMIDLLERKGRLRFLTGDYIGVTDPRALRRLLDIAGQFPEHADFRVFESKGGTFHPKSYLFYDSPASGVALVGSSNMTRPALVSGLEWNFRAVTSRESAGFADASAAFERLFENPKVQKLTGEWIEEYAKRRPVMRSVPAAEIAPADEKPAPPPVPHGKQQEALAALEQTRLDGNSAGLVVMATGLGKTWLAAFDSSRPEFKRALFVAHREEILRQAMQTFRRIRPEAHLGMFTGKEKVRDAEVVFASVQTIGRAAHLKNFDPDEFDYIVIDEFHHAAARTYRRLIDHFEPGFMLGLTATPERTDGGDLLALCQENLVYRCDLLEGVRSELLCPYHYFGVPDEVDYTNIPWRNNRFDMEALTTKVATQARAQNALEQYRDKAGTRTLAFCCSMRHADFMKDYFADAGLQVAAVHSGDNSDPRASSLEKLEAQELDVVFAVDMFNEGVDLPHVDTVMMLRPTESKILWLQQFGRGLRTAEGKSHLTVIDYIGNHRTFLTKVQAFFGLPSGDSYVEQQLRLCEKRELELPPGCEVTYDLDAVNILRALLRKPKDEDSLKFAYEDFRERNGVRPTATEMHHEGYGPRSARAGYGSWLGFVAAMGDLSGPAKDLLDSGRVAEFLRELEKTPMTKSYKMQVLLAMLAADGLPGSIGMDELLAAIRHLAARSAVLREDLGGHLGDDSQLEKHLLDNPINAWIGGNSTGRDTFFDYANGSFSTTFDVPSGSRQEFKELARELIDWRLAEYMDRQFRPSGDRPEGDEAGKKIAIGEASHREEIPSAFGLKYLEGRWKLPGYVFDEDQIFLFVTLNKSGAAAEHQYKDRFLSREVFEWQSQNQQAKDSKAGKLMYGHVEAEVPVRLFVRKTKKVGDKRAPYVYCGEVEFIDWERDKPITVRWRLKEPLIDAMAELFEATE